MLIQGEKIKYKHTPYYIKKNKLQLQDVPEIILPMLLYFDETLFHWNFTSILGFVIRSVTLSSIIAKFCSLRPHFPSKYFVI